MDYYTGVGSRNTPEHILNTMQNKIAGMMGLSYAAAWFNIRQATDLMQGQMMGNSILELTLKGIEEASAYNYVVNQVKH